MGCCGITSAGAAQNAAEIIDEAVAVGVLVRLVFLCEDKRTEPYLSGGRVYQFGNNERRRVNAVPARYAPNFLHEDGRYAGCFAEFDPAIYADNGEPLPVPLPDPV